MAYQAYYYASNPEKVKTVFGCKDKNFLEIIQQNKCYLAHDKQISVFKHLMIDIVMHYDGPDERKRKRFGLFPIEAVEGLGLSSRYAETYGFAVEALCDHFGEELDCPEDIFNYGRHWDQADQLLKEWGANVFLNKTTIPSKLFDIPKIKKFPVINAYTIAELQELDDILQKNLSLTNAIDANNKAHGLLNAFHKHAKHALEKDVPMVSFLY